MMFGSDFSVAFRPYRFREAYGHLLVSTLSISATPNQAQDLPLSGGFRRGVLVYKVHSWGLTARVQFPLGGRAPTGGGAPCGGAPCT